MTAMSCLAYFGNFSATCQIHWYDSNMVQVFLVALQLYISYIIDKYFTFLTKPLKSINNILHTINIEQTVLELTRHVHSNTSRDGGRIVHRLPTVNY